MGENSKIQWTDHTLNFWWGCQKVSPGCEHCYAESFSKRVGRDIWGPPKTTERWRTKGPGRDVLKWDRKAKADGVRRRVFCQSMSDFFEEHPQVELWRQEAFAIIESLEWLDVQILTKRPENVNDMVPAYWRNAGDRWPAHVWIGTSVENQETADRRIPELLKVPAKVRFLSCEPLLERISLAHAYPCGYYCDRYVGHIDHAFLTPEIHTGISWVIIGGESGPHARPLYLNWAREIIAQCRTAGVPVFCKQLGSNPRINVRGGGWTAWDQSDRKGGDPTEWPEDLRIREFPQSREPVP